MSAPEVLVNRDHLSRIAFANPGAVITFTADRAYLTLDGLTYVAVLPLAGAR